MGRRRAWWRIVDVIKKYPTLRPDGFVVLGAIVEEPLLRLAYETTGWRAYDAAAIHRVARWLRLHLKAATRMSDHAVTSETIGEYMRELGAPEVRGGELVVALVLAGIPIKMNNWQHPLVQATPSSVAALAKAITEKRATAIVRVGGTR